MSEHVDHQSGRSGPGFEMVLEACTRRKWIGLLALAAVFSCFVSLSVWLPDLYRATALVLVETPQVSEAFVRPLVTAELETRIQTIRQEVMSRIRLANLITQLDLYPDLRKKGVAFDDIIEQMRRDIDLDLRAGDMQITARGPTIAFAISYIGRDPRTVARVANVLATLYVNENTNIRAGQAASTAQFLRAQLDDVKKDLDAQERRASEFKLSHLGELPEQISANLASLERLNTQLRLNGDNQIRTMDRRERLEKQLAEIPAASPVAAPTSPRATQLAKLRQELMDLQRQFTNEYPDVVRVRAEIAALEQQGRETPTAPQRSSAPPVDLSARLNQAIGEVQTEVTALKAEEMALRRAIEVAEQRVQNVPKRHEELQSLSRDYQTTKERYDTLRKRYEEAQLAESLEQGRKVEQFRILDAAVPPRQPAAPARHRLLLAGLFVSIGIAVAAMLAAEKLDTSLHGIDDLRSFVRVPTLFSIPFIPTAADTRRHWRRIALTVVSAVVGLSLIVVGVRYVASGNEQIVRLVARGARVG